MSSWIFQILAFLFLLAGMVMTVVSLVKNILNITNIDSYALEQYDDIKTRANERGKKNFNRFTVTNFLISGIMMEIFSIVMSRFMQPLFGETAGAGYFSYFAQVNAVSWCIIFFIIFALAYIALAIISSVTFKKVKLDILKEDYGLDAQK